MKYITFLLLLCLGNIASAQDTWYINTQPQKRYHYIVLQNLTTRLSYRVSTRNLRLDFALLKNVRFKITPYYFRDPAPLRRQILQMGAGCLIAKAAAERQERRYEEYACCRHLGVWRVVRVSRSHGYRRAAPVNYGNAFARLQRKGRSNHQAQQKRINELTAELNSVRMERDSIKKSSMALALENKQQAAELKAAGRKIDSLATKIASVEMTVNDMKSSRPKFYDNAFLNWVDRFTATQLAFFGLILTSFSIYLKIHYKVRKAAQYA